MQTVALKSADVTSDKRNVHPTLRINIASVHFYLFSSLYLRPAQQITHVERLDPGARNDKTSGLKDLWKSYSKKTSSVVRRVAGGGRPSQERRRDAAGGGALSTCA